MRKPLSTLAISGLLLAASSAHAQTTAPAYDLSATHRYVQASQLWPQVQAEFTLRSGDYVLLGVQGRRLFDNIVHDNRSLGFDVRQAVVGYEHFISANARWSYGATARLLGAGGPAVFIPEVLLRHRSPVFGGIYFGQRLSVERAFGSGTNPALESGPTGQFWTRLRVDAERELPLGSGGVVLRPRLSYEAATHLRLQKEANDAEERTIQYTSLRAEIGLRLARVVDVTPWFARQTQYLETLPQYDATGNPTAGGKINGVFPTFGVDLRFTIAPAGTQQKEHQQLPTQH